MSQYTAPIDDIRFVLGDVLDAQSQFARLGHADATPDVVDAVLEEAARFTAGVLARSTRSSTSRAADTIPPRARSPRRTVQAAYAQYVDAGWPG